ncbi:MAG: hypothetical protein RIB58_03300 [Phycisphaerales bacterium]|jgi:hypothetical protein
MTNKPNNPHKPRRPEKPGLMRSLGAFVGEIVKAVKSDPDAYDDSQPRDLADDDEVILRRTTTTVDEVRVRKGDLDRKRS